GRGDGRRGTPGGGGAGEGPRRPGQLLGDMVRPVPGGVSEPLAPPGTESGRGPAHRGSLHRFREAEAGRGEVPRGAPPGVSELPPEERGRRPGFHRRGRSLVGRRAAVFRPLRPLRPEGPLLFGEAPDRVRRTGDSKAAREPLTRPGTPPESRVDAPRATRVGQEEEPEQEQREFRREARGGPLCPAPFSEVRLPEKEDDHQENAPDRRGARQETEDERDAQGELREREEPPESRGVRDHDGAQKVAPEWPGLAGRHLASGFGKPSPDELAGDLRKAFGEKDDSGRDSNDRDRSCGAGRSHVESLTSVPGSGIASGSVAVWSGAGESPGTRRKSNESWFATPEECGDSRGRDIPLRLVSLRRSSDTRRAPRKRAAPGGGIRVRRLLLRRGAGRHPGRGNGSLPD